MRHDFGYFEEEKLGKAYDIRLLKRIYPFLRPYALFLICSVALIIIIGLIDLSVPYISKVAIDRYIVPKLETGNWKLETGNATIRYLSINSTDSETKAIIRKYSNLFRTEENYALIASDDLSKLEKEDLAVLRRQDISGVTLAAAIFIVAISVSFVLNFFQVIIVEYTGQKAMYDLRMRLFSHIQSLAISFFTRNSVGRLVTRVTNDVQNMQEVFSSMIVLIFKDILLIVGVMIILISISWKLAIVSFAVIPFILFASLYFAGQAREVFRVLKVKVAEINTRFSETIGGIKIIQLFRQEEKNYRDFEELNHGHYLAGLDQVKIFARFLRFMGFLDVFVIAVVVFYGGTSVLRETISLGDLVAFLAYIKMFFGPIKDIGQKYNVMQNAMASAERIFLILDSEEKLPELVPCVPHSHDQPHHEKASVFNPLPSKISKIEMDAVSFAYLPDETVLNEISFKIHAGETIAVVGPTGSGKTTLINLIIRFYDPTSGQVLINGRDIRESEISALRANMALVTQDPFLFSGSIRDNIFQGNSFHSRAGDWKQEETERILTASNCKSFIDKLPKGLDTELSEGGASISSGERQLISIARAFARNPDVIILDEATSYIDSETEAKIQEALLNLMQNRTSLIVAHRLSTTRNADKIIVLNKGEIIESGTHEELMKNKGFYFKLNLLQQQ
ncbi:ABC transporter ATP-binding protein [Desulfonema magnum]|uniref:ABC transporter, ATP-binding protein n=1 Tax=Desulfonema magnum TaxID=45655 RepID=A0A975BKF0_9BACT|nr:ABC transporter ATP-binding protein [Desulfonema magnum]QTA86927.1 putative ABC transporter, ATP-binding protein [Desulfonema magnum]